uniref:N-acetyltransferase domain-containing protein n=1 Tax=Panagrellus redivivus TaxID=6233 RepID=A0A7E4ZUJ8_PANRE
MLTQKLISVSSKKALILRSLHQTPHNERVRAVNANAKIADTAEYKREVLYRFKLPNNKEITFEKSDPKKDATLLKSFFTAYFADNEPIGRYYYGYPDAENAVADYLEPLYSFAVLAKVEGNIIGGSSFITKKLNSQLLELPEFPKDFGKIIEKGPTPQFRANVVINYNNACESVISYYAPSPCTVSMLNGVAVHPKFRGLGLAKLLNIAGFQVAYEQGSDYVGTNCTSPVNAQLFCDLPGQKLVHKFKYADYQVNGDRPFAELAPKDAFNGIFLMDLKQHWPEYQRLLKSVLKEYKK